MPYTLTQEKRILEVFSNFKRLPHPSGRVKALPKNTNGEPKMNNKKEYLSIKSEDARIIQKYTCCISIYLPVADK